MQYQVRDGTRLITFDGKELGSVSSRRDGAARWTEMTIYLSDGGTYVLEKVGRSVVTHMPGCPEILKEIPRFQVAHPGDDPEDYDFHDCVPDEYDFTKLLSEEDRYWATMAERPEMIIDALYRRRAGSRHLPKVSIELLEAVSLVDSGFTTWRVEHIA